MVKNKMLAPSMFVIGTFIKIHVFPLQIAGTSFTMTFWGKGYSTKAGSIDEQHIDKPDKEIITQITGPGYKYI